jgi:hypothetical protein
LVFLLWEISLKKITDIVSKKLDQITKKENYFIMKNGQTFRIEQYGDLELSFVPTRNVRQIRRELRVQLRFRRPFRIRHFPDVPQFFSEIDKKKF